MRGFLSEVNACIALLLVQGAYGGKNFPHYSFGIKNGTYYFFNKPCRKIVVVRICVFLCFDLGSTRSARLQTEKFDLFSNIWNRLVNNSISHYKPGENITIDEQLSSTKSRCRYTQYIPKKPDKFLWRFNRVLESISILIYFLKLTRLAVSIE